jgi:hypothetical protein
MGFPTKGFVTCLAFILITAVFIAVEGPTLYLLSVYLILSGLFIWSVNELFDFEKYFIPKLVWVFSFILCILGQKNSGIFEFSFFVSIASVFSDLIWIFSKAGKKFFATAFRGN